MIAHIVLFKERQGLAEEDRRAFAAALERAAREIPSVRGVRIGRRLLHGAGYEQDAGDADYLAIIEFDEVAGLHAYLGHPAHQELARRFRGALSAAWVLDFEVGGLEMLETLLQNRAAGGPD